MKTTSVITKEITYNSDQHSTSPESVKLTFSAEDVDRIARVMILVKENKLHSAKIDFGNYVLLNDEGEEDLEFCDDQAQLIIYSDRVYFYCQDSDCYQIESDGIDFNEIMEGFTIINAESC